MTYCLGVKLREGLICLADGRITSGGQVSIARKASLHGPAEGRVCIMTSGLRSLRDKTITYFEQDFSSEPLNAANMIEVRDIYTRSLPTLLRFVRNHRRADWRRPEPVHVYDLPGRQLDRSDGADTLHLNRRHRIWQTDHGSHAQLRDAPGVGATGRFFIFRCHQGQYDRCGLSPRYAHLCQGPALARNGIR